MAKDFYAELWKKTGVDKDKFEKEYAESVTLVKAYKTSLEELQKSYDTKKEEYEASHKAAIKQLSSKHEENCRKLKKGLIESRLQMVNFQIIEKDIKNVLCRYDNFDKRSKGQKDIEAFMKKVSEDGSELDKGIESSIQISRENLDCEYQQITEEVQRLFNITCKYSDIFSQMEDIDNDTVKRFKRLKEVSELIMQHTFDTVDVFESASFCDIDAAFNTDFKSKWKYRGPDNMAINNKIDVNPPLQANGNIGDVLNECKQECVKLRLQFPSYNV